MTEGNPGNLTLNVSAARLKEQADVTSDKIKEMTEMFEELEEVISRTSHYWNGEAGDYYRILYGENKEEIEDMLKRLKEHPAKLLQAARICGDEQQEEKMASPLPGDVIL